MTVSDPGYDKDHNEVPEDLTVTGTFKGADPDSDHSLEFGVSTTPATAIPRSMRAMTTPPAWAKGFIRSKEHTAP
mgnify:CR=1 FL=1